jgi:hypothetical protein
MQSCRDNSRTFAEEFVWPTAAQVTVVRAKKIPNSRLIVRED